MTTPAPVALTLDSKVQCGTDHLMTVLELAEMWNDRYAYPTYRCGDYSTYPFELEEEDPAWNATADEILELVTACPTHDLPIALAD